MRARRRGVVQPCGQLRSPAAIFPPQPRHACPPPLLSAQHRSRVSARAARSAEEKRNGSTKPIQLKPKRLAPVTRSNSLGLSSSREKTLGALGPPSGGSGRGA